MNPRYPVYVISKGRSDCCLTARFLVRDKVPFKLVVEPQERELYTEHFGDHVVALPFSNLGLGSIPARNWVKDDATASGAERHWIFDDNIRKIYRRWHGKKIPCEAGPALRAAEDFVDRYENIAIGGLNYTMFVPDRRAHFPPFFQNVHVYSCLLIQNSLPHRWRGRYNEDTDLCLQVLADGFCTVLFNAFLIEKMPTMTMKGGNSAELYKGDGRLKMARSLERMWPGVVETKRRFQRPQHVIKNAWKNFDTPLKLKSGIDVQSDGNEYGMKLKMVKEIKSERLRQIVAGKIEA